MIYFSRLLRNLKENANYPLWALRGKPVPDNHLFKVRRIRSIGKEYECDSFIETGTFYGQTIHAVKKQFKKVLSVELYGPLYQYNKNAFEKSKNVTIYFGDSSNKMKEMIRVSTGRILFWLDGHYSGSGTACGDIESPILMELNIIKEEGKRDSCILIDDARLFTGKDGYPTIEEIHKLLFEINSDYKLIIDSDCIVALPQF